jgi:hypothetical protein
MFHMDWRVSLGLTLAGLGLEVTFVTLNALGIKMPKWCAWSLLIGGIVQ